MPSTIESGRSPLAQLIMAFALALIVMGGAAIAPSTAAAVGGSEFVRRTNEYRASVGLPAVSLHAAVDRIAVERANQMAARRSMTHDLAYVQRRLAELGVCYSAVGEIIAVDGWPEQSYERTMGQWWRSDGHRAILLGGFSHAGGSWARGTDASTYSAMIFVNACATAKISVSSVGRVVFSAGSHTGYRSSGGTMVAAKTATLSSTSGANAGERRRIAGRVYYAITNGIWAGLWMPESSRAHVKGIFDKTAYAAPVRLSFAAGTHTGYRYDTAGTITARKAYTLTRTSGAAATHVAIINGRRHFLVTNGIWAGYWVPDTAGVSFER